MLRVKILFGFVCLSMQMLHAQRFLEHDLSAIVAQPTDTKSFVETVDFNGDTWKDVIYFRFVENAAGYGHDVEFVLIQNAGDGTFLEAHTLYYGLSTHCFEDVYFEDYNQDGDKDILVRCRERVYVYKLENGIYFEPSLIGAFGLQDVQLVDIDSDGYQDIVICESEECVIRTSISNGSFEEAEPLVTIDMTAVDASLDGGGLGEGGNASGSGGATGGGGGNWQYVETVYLGMGGHSFKSVDGGSEPDLFYYKMHAEEQGSSSTTGEDFIPTEMSIDLAVFKEEFGNAQLYNNLEHVYSFQTEYTCYQQDRWACEFENLIPYCERTGASGEMSYVFNASKTCQFADFDGDQDLDYACWTDNRYERHEFYYHENVDGEFILNTYPLFDEGVGGYAIDIDEDGFLDVLEIERNNIGWRKQNANVWETQYSLVPIAAALGAVLEDFDNDGIPEVLSWSSCGYVQVSKRTDPGTFGIPQKIFEGSVDLRRNFDLFDVDLDGTDDIVFVEARSGAIQYLAMTNGLPTETAVPIGHNYNSPGSFVFGDLTGDNLSDLVVYDHFDRQIYLQERNEDGSFGPAVSFANEISACNEMRIQDVDADGLNDIVLEAGKVSWLKNVGDQAELQEVDLGPEPVEFIFANLDDDPGLEVLLMVEANDLPSGLNRYLEVLYADGTSYGAAISTYANTNLGFDVKDVDGNGYLDVFVRTNNTAFIKFNYDGVLTGLTDVYQFVSQPKRMLVDPFETGLFHLLAIDEIEGISDLGYTQLMPDCDATLSITSIPGYNGTDFIFGDLDGDGDLDLLDVSGDNQAVRWIEHIPNFPEINIVFDSCFEDEFFPCNYSVADYKSCSIEWDFGDGNVSNEPYPTHTYAENGNYVLSLVICNGALCDSLEADIIIYDEEEQPPLIPEEGIAGTEISFDAGNDLYTNYSWVFGDGEVSTELAPTHTYIESGTYTVELFMTDSSSFDCTYHHTQEIIIEGDIGFGDNNLNQISISPNPVIDELHLSMGNLGAQEIEVYNTLGQKVWSQSVNWPTASCHVSNWSSGLYVLSIRLRDGRVLSEKIVVKP